MNNRTRWLALITLCLGSLMIVLDTTIVNVALPSIQTQLGFSKTNLAWVVNAYMLTFGGCLLLSGRLGDLYGHRRLFLMGIVMFTIASMVCGTADTQAGLIIARAVQGLAGAVVSAVSLSLLMNLFTQDAERARAMGIFGFVSAGGGALGVFLGGLLTNSLDWHWVFLVNVPIGISVLVASLKLLPTTEISTASKKLDMIGAITITASLMCAVYGMANSTELGFANPRIWGTLLAAICGIGLFICIEKRVKSPLMPLELFRLRNVAVANVMGILWAAAMFAWFFLSALYLQVVLSLSPLQVGLSFLPANIIMAIFSVGLSARIVLRFGIKRPLMIGMLLAATGLFWLARVPVDGTVWIDVLPSMILLGLGAGTAFNPMFLAAMSGVAPQQSGLASGVVNTSFMMGGALGLATLASLAAARSEQLIQAGYGDLSALVGGYHVAFAVGGLAAASAGVIAAFLLKVEPVSESASPPPTAH